MMFLLIVGVGFAFDFNNARQLSDNSIMSNINLTAVNVVFIDERFVYNYNIKVLKPNPADLGEFAYFNQNIIGIIELDEINTCYNEYDDLRRCFDLLVTGREPFDIGDQTLIPLAYQIQEMVNFHYRDSLKVRDDAIDRVNRVNEFMRMGVPDLNISIGLEDER